jgi:hypothetical protein
MMRDGYRAPSDLPRGTTPSGGSSGQVAPLPVIRVERHVEQEVTDEMVIAAMRAFEPMAGRLLRYPEKDRWHVNDILGMRLAIKAALSVKSN